MSKLMLAGMSAAFLFLSACTHTAVKREPTNYTVKYDRERTALLKLAAENSLLFQISDDVVRDLPTRSIGNTCRTTENGPWIDHVYSTLQVFRKQPDLAKKIHLIEFRRGDSPKAEISRDLDGAVLLVLSYAKVEQPVPVTTLSDIPCASGSMDMIGKDMRVTSFEWPSAQSIAMALMKVGPRPQVERYNIDNSFLLWLAERMSIFRMTPELAFEKTHLGHPLLPVFFAQMRDEIHMNHEALEFWIHEISQRSKIGQQLMFFGLKRDAEGTVGLTVDSKEGEFARRFSGFIDPTYPYLSYRLENNGFTITQLSTLDHCLESLRSSYRSPIALMGTFKVEPESFMFPGQHCGSETR